MAFDCFDDFDAFFFEVCCVKIKYCDEALLAVCCDEWFFFLEYALHEGWFCFRECDDAFFREHDEECLDGHVGSGCRAVNEYVGIASRVFVDAGDFVFIESFAEVVFFEMVCFGEVH